MHSMQKSADDALRGVFIPEKILLIPICGLVDVSAYIPIVTHPYFQLLNERKQLAFAYKVFAGARHARLEHCVGTMHFIRLMIRHFHITDPVIIRALEVFALLHDIGHMPFCHEFEQIAGIGHKEVSLQRITVMRHEISQCADYDLVEALFLNNNPLSRLVTDKNFGADKLDYLQRDAHHTGYNLVIHYQNIINYLQYLDGELGIDAKAKEEIINYQFSYLRMYNHVYRQKTVKTFARMFQRAVLDSFAGPREIKQLYGYTDSEIFEKLYGHFLYDKIRNRQVHKTVMVFKIAGYEQEELVGKRPFTIVGIDPARIQQWSQRIEDIQFLLELENELAKELGLLRGQALVVQPNFDSKTVCPDVSLYQYNRGKFASLFNLVPSHPNNLQEAVDRAFYIRVVVDCDYLEQAHDFDYHGFFQAYFG